ncbi:MAG: tRNA-guanine transglycosylase, partial [Acidimicrobiia bacterium]
RCRCEVCARHSRGYIRHLFQVGEPTASRLLSLHNIGWTLQLMDEMRAAIVDGRFAALRSAVLDVWA